MKHRRQCLFCVSCNQVELVIVPVSRPTQYSSIDCTAISQTSNFGLIRRERSAFKNWLCGDRTLHIKVLEKSWQMLPILSQAFIKASSLKLWKFPYGDPGGPSCSQISVWLQHSCCVKWNKISSKKPYSRYVGGESCWIIHVMLSWLSEHFRCDGLIRILTTFDICALVNLVFPVLAYNIHQKLTFFIYLKVCLKSKLFHL